MLCVWTCLGVQRDDHQKIHWPPVRPQTVRAALTTPGTLRCTWQTNRNLPKYLPPDYTLKILAPPSRDLEGDFENISGDSHMIFTSMFLQAPWDVPFKFVSSLNLLTADSRHLKGAWERRNHSNTHFLLLQHTVCEQIMTVQCILLFVIGDTGKYLEAVRGVRIGSLYGRNLHSCSIAKVRKKPV